ncbi:MAG: YbbR-like domain-containing protein [Sandaracinaceae bacterium]
MTVAAWLRRALTEDLGLKVTALGASVILFVSVHGTEDAQMTVAVDVLALLPPDPAERMLISEVPREVRLTLRGTRSLLSALRRDPPPPITMDLRDTEQHFYYVDQDDFEVPLGAEIVQVAPAAIPLSWVDRAEREVRVVPDIAGEVTDGYRLAATEVEPDQVLVGGAANEVERLTQLSTETVDVTGLLDGRHERRVPLSTLPPHCAYDGVQSVRVTLVVEKEFGSRRFRRQEVVLVGAPGATVRPRLVNVIVRGPRLDLEELEAEAVVPTVEVPVPTSGERTTQRLRVVIEGLPEGFTAEVDPAEVLVTTSG